MTRTISAIRTEAAYLQHKLASVEQAMENAPLADLRELYTVQQALRNGLLRCEQELREQGQADITSINGAMEFTLL